MISGAPRPRARGSALPARSQPMARRKPLAPGAGLTRGTGLTAAGGLQRKPAAAGGKRRTGTATGAPKAPGGFTPAVRLAVMTRAGSGDPAGAMCECCGRFPQPHNPLEIQHRAARGAGGCRDAVIQSAANAAVLCRWCHVRAEARDPGLRDDAGGFWIRHGRGPAFDPRHVAVLLAGPGGGGARVWLAEDGRGPDGTGYLLSAPAVAA